MSSYINIIDDSRLRQWVEVTKQSIEQCHPNQLLNYLVKVNYSRIYMIEHNMLPHCILDSTHYDIRTVAYYQDKILAYTSPILEEIGLNNLHEIFKPDHAELGALSAAIGHKVRQKAHLVGMAQYWLMILLSGESAYAKDLSVCLFQALRKVVPQIFSCWRDYNPSAYEYDFQQSRLFHRIEEDIARIPMILGLETNDDEYDRSIETMKIAYDRDIKVFDRFIKLLNGLPEENLSILLALAHQLRVHLTYSGLFPDEMLSDPNPKHSKLKYYIQTFKDYMDSADQSNNAFMNYLSAKIWYLTAFGLARPGLYLDHVDKIWQVLSRAHPTVFEIWSNRIERGPYAEKGDFHLFATMEEDIKKIPAALRE